MNHLRTAAMDFADINGTRTAFLTSGTGSPLLLIHGAEADHSMFQMFMEALSSRYTAIAYDQRDSGLTRNPEHPCSLLDLAADAAALISHLGVGRTHVFGTSLGGNIAQVLASEYPARPVTIVLPFPAGGPSDIYARLIAQKLQLSLKQPFIVENRPGATGLIGTAAVARAAGDGYTLLITSNSSHIISPLLRAKPPYDPIRDFEPITILGHYPLCLIVNNSVQATNTKELIALAKQNPGKLFFGTIGEGSGTHLMAELFKQKAGIDIVHVPYKGGAAVNAALIAGDIQMYFDGVGSAKKFVDAGRSRAIAVTSEKRSTLLPGVPTLDEAGLGGFNQAIWLGVFAPRGTPPAVVSTLYREIKKILDTDADVRKLFADTGTEISGLAPTEVNGSIRAEQRVWKELIDRLGVRLE
jgi:tripartite-type tricarboxylate transporter receptor subunit TctC